MGKVKTQTPLDLAREKTGRLATMLTEVVDGVRALQEEKKQLAEQVDALLRDAAPDALTQAGRLTEQGEGVAVDLARKAAMVEGIEENIRASASALAVLEREENKARLEAEGPELIEVRRALFERARGFLAGFADELKATEASHYQHQVLREKVFGSPDGRAMRELHQLRSLVQVLTVALRGMPK